MKLCLLLSDPGTPGVPPNDSGRLFATHGCCQDLTDGTLTDEVTNSIPTDELTILSIKYGNSSGIIWWPDFQIIMQLLAKFVINANGVT